jgi:hypothetical protein
MGWVTGRREFLEVLGAGTGLATLLEAGRAEGAAARLAPPGGVYDPTRFGAVGDGKTSCTQSLQKTIDACAAGGGGMVVVPPGRYVSGALFLRSNVHLHLTAGATLAASQRFEDFPPIDGRWEGIERKIHTSLLNGIELENVTLSGQGTLDGQAEPWWRAFFLTRDLRVSANLPREAENPAGAPLKWPRPRLVYLQRCQGVHLSGLLLRDAPSYNVHLVYCQDALVDAITAVAHERNELQRPDGLVVDSCKQVRIANCSIGSGGDCIGIKSGYNEDGWRIGIPSEEIAIINCHLHSSAGAGIAVGSETSGGIKNITISNCTITRCNNGVFVRSPRGRGGMVERIRASNLVFEQLKHAAIKLSNYFDSVRLEGSFSTKPPSGNPETDRSVVRPIEEGTPTFKDFEFTGLVVGEVPDVAIIEGLPERFIHGVRLQDVSAPRSAAGVSCTRATDVSVGNLRVGPLEHAAVAAHDVERLEVYRLAAAAPSASSALIELENVAGAFVHGCDVPTTDDKFVRQQGTRNRAVHLVGNNVTSAKV